MNRSMSVHSQHAALIVLLMLPACVVHLEGVQDQDGGTSGAGGTGGASTPTCHANDLLEGQRTTIYQRAADNLAAQGTPVDRSSWTDEASFDAFMREAYDLAGCDAPDDKVQEALGTHKEFYCGPGHGGAKLGRPEVGDCFNEACKLHDACYAMCDGPTDNGCYWTVNTGSCDGPLLQRLDACATSESFAEGAVRFIASLLKIKGELFSCGTLTCPVLGALGGGVCSTNPEGSDCANCLAEADPAGECRDLACPAVPLDPHCYAATCLDVGECYARYGRGLPGAVDTPTPVPDPDSARWSVTVVRGILPETDASGSPWDVTLLGFDPPDPFVRVAVGSFIAQTTSPEDTYVAQWNEVVLNGIAASDLRAGIQFEVWDEDLIDHDLVGTCTLQLDNGSFAAQVLHPDCDLDGLSLSFKVTSTPD